MGSSATTLYSLVNQKVNITTPVVELSNWHGVIDSYEKPCVFVQIKYTVGIDGSNILILKERDVLIITDLMMGGDGTNVEGEIGELQLSAISEAMNQMMGAAATSISTMIGEKVDISPPKATVLEMIDDDPRDIAEFLTGTFCKISFKMQISDLVDSSLMQLYPIDFAKSLYDTFSTSTKGNSEPTAAQGAAAMAPPPDAAPAQAADGSATGDESATDDGSANDGTTNDGPAYDDADAADDEYEYITGAVPEFCRRFTYSFNWREYRYYQRCSIGSYSRTWTNSQAYCGHPGFCSWYYHRA